MSMEQVMMRIDFYMNLSVVHNMHMCNTDTILDSGATESMFPINYPNLSKFISNSSHNGRSEDYTKTLWNSKLQYNI